MGAYIMYGMVNYYCKRRHHSGWSVVADRAVGWDTGRDTVARAGGFCWQPLPKRHTE
jgi:hypothetical protein